MLRKLEETFVVVWYDKELTPVTFAQGIESYNASLEIGEQGLKDMIEDGAVTFNIEKYYKLAKGNK
ncbi:hypothetical protein BK703_16725 [Bacillus thuringiensis serovar silo]|uniref:hypothetical protein n=1 Tax=Bacillus thuringiensis TaxID=1428 RepID=UPI000A3D3594|nr:hypothetical protein [Bacillus thuringiensis]MED3275428.1 hypothetical protein [Bacillus thuringiensis]OTW55282.1 hypothetical protein BK703_16725 [Bacillus thuringiensis serovar silo]OTW74286.1 hypothetical protein BK700_01320 [Bacillus thuringiensis serovar toguchini]